jgi:hypothetical protein
VSDRFYWFILGALGVWRVTHLLNAEDGPWQLLARFRKLVGSGFWGGLLDCFYCLSLWAAAPYACWLRLNRHVTWSEALLLWPALSALAILLERATTNQPATFFEDPEGE